MAPRDVEDLLKHHVGKPAGLRILLTRVIRPDEHETISKRRDLSMLEAMPRSRKLNPALFQSLQARAEGDLAERHDDPHIVQQVKLGQEKRATAAQLGRGRPVAGRRTAHRRCDVAVGETQTIASIGRDGLVGEARSIKGSIEEVSAPVPREDPASPVATVGGGGQPDHQQPRSRITKARDWSPPVLPITVPPNLLAGRPLAMPDQARASSARDDPSAECDHLPRCAGWVHR